MTLHAFSPKPAIYALMAAISLASSLAACQAKTPNAPNASITDLANTTRNQLVAIQGGTFKMGDFGETHSEEKLPYTGEPDDGPVHEVKLDDFSMSKHKVTVGDYDVYAAANGLHGAYLGPNQSASDKMVRLHPKIGQMPVGVDWQDAKNYCQWIGKQMGQNMDLPTEAEWEFAARARGKQMIFATNNGEDQPGVNFATFNKWKLPTTPPAICRLVCSRQIRWGCTTWLPTAMSGPTTGMTKATTRNRLSTIHKVHPPVQVRWYVDCTTGATML